MVEENKETVPTNHASESSAPSNAAASKKSASVSKKKGLKKTAHKKAGHETKAVSQSVKNSKEISWKLVSIILGIVMLLLIAGVVAIYLMKNQTTPSVDTTNNAAQANNSVNTGAAAVDASADAKIAVQLAILEDPSCTTCQVDLFANNVKSNLIPALTVSKISITSTEGKQLLSTLKATQVPVYLFSKSLDQRSDWTTNLVNAFQLTNVNGKDYYMLNPQFVQNKVMIESPIVTPTAVTLGNPNAKVTIIEFSDFECPFCGIAEGNTALVTQFTAQSPGYIPTMPSVFKDYIDTGKVKFVFYNFPLVQIHKNAMSSANAAMCANEQKKWREFKDKLFLERDSWVNEADPKAAYTKFATTLSLDIAKFDTCYTSNKYQTQIESEIKLGASYGVSGTPAFFVGKNFVSGAQDYNAIKVIIDAELAK